MGSGRPQAAGASSPVILSAAKNPSPIVHPFQRPPRIPRRDEHLCPLWVLLVRFAQQTIVCVSRRSSRVRYIKWVRKAHHLIRHGCAVPPSPQGEGFGFASGKLRSFRTPGRSPLRVRASPTGDGGRRSDVGILRDSSSSLPTGERGRQGAVPTGLRGRQGAVPTGERGRQSAVPTGERRRQSAVPTGLRGRQSAVPTSCRGSVAAHTGAPRNQPR